MNVHELYISNIVCPLLRPACSHDVILKCFLLSLSEQWDLSAVFLLSPGVKSLVSRSVQKPDEAGDQTLRGERHLVEQGQSLKWRLEYVGFVRRCS